MYTLYWSTGCGSFAPHAALNEAGAQFNLIEIKLEANQHRTPEFLALNPRAQVPVLTLVDGTVMTESVAMLLQIADCHPEVTLLPSPGSSQRALAYRWLVFCAVNLYEAGCRVSHPQYYTQNTTEHDGIRRRALNDLNDYWIMAAGAIEEGPFFFGANYSVIDICLLMIVQWHPDKHKLFERLPKLATLCDAVRERPAVDRIWHLNFPI